jgi:hypothetical protein
MPWSFPLDAATAVVTTTHVMRGGKPILLVICEIDEDGDEAWQFHCDDGDYDPSRLMLVRLDEVLDRDPALAETMTLEVGQMARRRSVNDAWEFGPVD